MITINLNQSQYEALIDILDHVIDADGRMWAEIESATSSRTAKRIARRGAIVRDIPALQFGAAHTIRDTA